MVVGGDSLPWQKPHARVLRVVADAMGVPCTDLLHVGDSAIDVESGRNAGVRVWALPHGYNAGRPIAEACPDALWSDLMSVAHAALGAAPSSLHPQPSPCLP